MKRKSILLAILFLLQMGFTAQAQLFEEGDGGWEVPNSYTKDINPNLAPNVLDSVCSLYNDDVIKCHEWLQNTLIGEQVEKRSEADRFIIVWSIATPTVHILIDKRFMYSDKKEHSLMVAYLGGWSKFALQHTNLSGDELQIQSCIAGIEAELELYSRNEKYFSSNKDLKKFIKIYSTMKKKGELESVVKKYFEEHSDAIKNAQ